MSKIRFSEFYNEIKALLQKFQTMASDNERTNKYCDDIREILDKSSQKENKLRIAIIGEFASGKTSLIKAMTGQEHEMIIGAGPTTDKTTTYDYNGLYLIDTPGVKRSEKLHRHDQISKEETMKADLVIFVVTTELFNDELANYLRYVIAEGQLENGETCLGLHSKTAIVVNKMDRLLEDEERKQNIYDSVAKVTAPYTLPIFLFSAQEYLGSIETNAEFDEDEKIEIEKNFNQFTKELDTFVADKGQLGKLMAFLTSANSLVDKILQDSDSESLKEKLTGHSLLKKKTSEKLKEFEELSLDSTRQLGNAISSVGNKHAEKLDRSTSMERFQIITKEAQFEANEAFKTQFEEAQLRITDFLKSFWQEIQELCQGENMDLEGFEIPKIVTEMGKIDESLYNFAKYGKPIAEAAVRCVQEICEHAADPQNLKAIVKAFYNIKWRPWGVSKKAAEWAAKFKFAGKAIPFLSAGLEMYLNYREEKEKDAQEKFVADMRIGLREFIENFSTDAKRAFQKAFQDVKTQHLLKIRNLIEKDIEEFRMKESEEKTVVRNYSDFKRNIDSLRTELSLASIISD